MFKFHAPLLTGVIPVSEVAVAQNSISSHAGGAVLREIFIRQAQFMFNIF